MASELNSGDVQNNIFSAFRNFLHVIIYLTLMNYFIKPSVPIFFIVNTSIIALLQIVPEEYR